MLLMRKLSIELSEKLSLSFIDDYYNKARYSISLKYDKLLNGNFENDFCGRTTASVEDEAKELFAELEKEATLCLLSYLESIFRMDFIIRCDLKKKDKLSLLFRKSYDRSKRKYQYGFKDVVINGWKSIYPEYKNTFDGIIQMMDYRNWLAHGRYWTFKDNPEKYRYWAVYKNIELFENAFINMLNRPSKVGDMSQDKIY